MQKTILKLLFYKAFEVFLCEKIRDYKVKTFV